MRNHVCGLGATFALLALLASGAARLASSAPLPPLKVEKSAPHLEDGPAQSAPAVPGKRRLVCYDCHVNYQEEPFAAKHAGKDVTCVSCHGESRAHCNDENNITPPDRIYAREAIAPACAPCHATHNAPAQKVLERWKERGLSKMDPKQVVCTDCHGAHRLKVRSVRWDKTTRKLLPLRGGRAPKPAAPRTSGKASGAASLPPAH